MTETVDRYDTFRHLTSWDEITQEAANLREDMDEHKWRMGALVNFACGTRRAGRPKKDDGGYTVAALASAIDEDRSVLSQLAASEEFYWPEIREEIPKQISWRRLARARTHTGWRPGKPVTRELIQEALTRVYREVEEAPVKPEVSLQQAVERALAQTERCLKYENLGDCRKLLLTAAESLKDARGLLI